MTITFILLTKLSSTLKAIRLSLFPLLYFFVFLYYTDVGSTMFILASYYFAQQKRFTLSALVNNNDI